MNKLCHRLWLGTLLFATSVLTAQAQSVTPEQEYQKLIQVDQNVQPLGEHPFGENINLYDGSLSFNLSDVTLRGNGPTIVIGRTLSFWAWDDPALNALRPFGDWDLDIPRIETLAGGTGESPIWQTMTSGSTPSVGTTQRCSTFNPPPGIASSLSPGGWVPDEWWYGYNLLVPGEGKQLLMPRTTANFLSPTISGKSFPIVTKNNWMVSCGVTASDGGEGFLAIAPDGTRYTFAHLVYRPYNTIIGAGALAPDIVSGPKSSNLLANGASPMQGVGGVGLLFRRDAFMYVTQIQDRFGNTLTYNYDSSTGYLSSITANDGREVDVAYVPGTPEIQSITAKAANVSPRTWHYNYAGPTQDDALVTLTSVQLPDGSAWSYQLGVIQSATIYPQNGNCQLNALPTLLSTGGAVPTITAPSGLTATFNVEAKLSGRSYVPRYCYGHNSTNGTEDTAVYPEYSTQFAMVSEVVSGAGMPTQTWNYSYSPINQSWSNDPCATSGTCATTVYTDVTDPNGNDIRYTFSNRFDATEGLLLSKTYANGAAGSPLLRSETYTYANPTGGPWPTTYGTDLLYRDNQAQVTELSPQSQHTITQDSTAYTWQAMAFNEYGEANDVKRFNSITGQTPIEEKTSYLYDTALWVLALPIQVTNVTTGEVESLNTYNPNDTLYTRSRFGQTLMTYTFNSAGQLASFEDGNSNTTSLSSYYRGIPQLISYPDGTTESLVVDDLGQIKSITDQNNHTTTYGYDVVGRIASITYPAGDETSWYPKTFTYTPVSSNERGITGFHWDRTETTGNYNETTYFDAMLRPVLTDSNITSGGAIVANSDISQQTTYDYKGQTLFSSYPQRVAANVGDTSISAGVTRAYDALERVTSSKQDAENNTSLITTTTYDPGAGVTVTDPNNNATTTYYQVFDEPSYSAPIQVATAEGITQNILRDIYGNPSQITQSGLYNGTETDSVTKSLYYDSYHRLCRTSEPESGSTLTSYDPANNVHATATDIAGAGCETLPTGSTTVYTYDKLNRVKTITPPAGTESIQYIYDSVGNLQWATASSPSGSSIWEGKYNFQNMLTNETLNFDSINALTIAYAHDAYGHLNSVTYPNGEVVPYAPDPRGWPSQAGAYASQVNYFANGDVASFAYGNGASYVAHQNQRQLLSDYTYLAPDSLANIQEVLGYDNNANLLNDLDYVTGQRGKSFTYDGVNRLKTAQGSWGTESYTYDALNNLRTRAITAPASTTNTYTYSYTNNQLQSITTSAGTTLDSFGYDTRGNETNKNGNILTFDMKDQLTQIQGYDSYLYDASGRRITTTPANGGAPTYWLYSHAGQMMYQYAPGNSQATNFIYLGSKLIAKDAFVQLGAPGPISFSANPNDGSYTVNWGSVPLAVTYTLQESFNGGPWTSVYSSTNSYAFTGRNGGGYVYQVQACSGSTCGPWTTSSTLGVTPALPTNITVPAGVVTSSYTVGWTAPIGAVNYSVQQSVNGGPWITVASAVTSTSITVPVTASGIYVYEVSASNAYGTRGWTSASAAVNVLGPPGPISFTSYTNPNDGNYIVNWSGGPPATSYVLQKQSNGGAFSTVYSGADTSYTVAADPGGTYVYQVQACDGNANNVCSAWTTSAPLGISPPLPTNLVVPSTLVYTVGLSWTGSPGATSYTVQQNFNGNGWTGWTTIATGVTGTSFSYTPNVGGTYMYRVAALNQYGSQGFLSSPVAVSVTQIPTTPTSFVVPSTGTVGDVVLNWTAMPWATTYQVGVEQIDSINLQITYTYHVDDAASWSLPLKAGQYNFSIAACSIGGCSAPILGGPLTLTNATSSEATIKSWIGTGKRILGADTGADNGCGNSQCTITAGGNP